MKELFAVVREVNIKEKGAVGQRGSNCLGKSFTEVEVLIKPYTKPSKSFCCRVLWSMNFRVRQ
jgi:hypothetical protein